MEKAYLEFGNYLLSINKDETKKKDIKKDQNLKRDNGL